MFDSLVYFSKDVKDRSGNYAEQLQSFDVHVVVLEHIGRFIWSNHCVSLA